MIVLDTLLIGGLRFVLGRLAEAVEAEMDGDASLREELLAVQMRLELGEITETEFVATERALLDRIAEIRERRPDAAAAPRGGLRVTGVEVTFEDGETREERRAERRVAAPARRAPRRREVGRRGRRR
jgi:gas vesicle protein GvpG